MQRKRKLEQAKPSSSSNLESANKYNRWRSAVEDLLTERWQSSLDVQSVAATVVGMFDAGATDAEVAAFLRTQERSDTEEPSLTDDARNALVHDLHGSAGI
jgi:hypothetical protein